MGLNDSEYPSRNDYLCRLSIQGGGRNLRSNAVGSPLFASIRSCACALMGRPARGDWSVYRGMAFDLEMCCIERLGHGTGGFAFVPLWSEGLFGSDDGSFVRWGVADANSGVDEASSAGEDAGIGVGRTSEGGGVSVAAVAFTTAVATAVGVPLFCAVSRENQIMPP
jgi:hypothetical protein